MPTKREIIFCYIVVALLTLSINWDLRLEMKIKTS